MRSAGRITLIIILTIATVWSATVVRVERFTCTSDDNDGWWLAITAMRKTIEWLADNDAAVESELTDMNPESPPGFIIEAKVSISSKDMATLELKLEDISGNETIENSISHDKQAFREFRSVLGRMVLYALNRKMPGMEKISVQSRPCTSSVAFGMYLLAVRKLRAGEEEQALNLLKIACQKDSLFNMACWTGSEILTKQNKSYDAKKWSALAEAIDEEYPRWRYRYLGSNKPPLEKLLESSRAKKFIKVHPGLWYKHISTGPKELEVYLWRVDCKSHIVDVCIQGDSSGSRISEFFRKCGSLVALNGGFFDVNRNLTLSPSGLLVKSGEVIKEVSKEGGSGVFCMKDGKPNVIWSRKLKHPEKFDMAVQCGPVIVEPGGVMGVYSNNYKRANRSAVGIESDSLIVLCAVRGNDQEALSLYEFAAFLKTPLEQGGAGCDVALNLDGGSSTQMCALGQKRGVCFDGLWAVHNAIVVKKKHEQ